MISRETVCRSRWPCIIPVNRARFEFNQSCSALRAVVSRRFAIIWLTFSLSASTSPFASTVTWRVRSPSVTAVDTSAIARTCVVTDAAHVRLAAELALGADLARDAGDLVGERAELVDHCVDGVLELEHLTLRVDGHFLREIAVRHGGRHLRDVAHLLSERVRHEVHVVGEVAPHAADAVDRCLTPEAAFGADLARDARDLVGERAELVD